MSRTGYAEVIGAASGGTANAGWFGDGRDGDLYVAAGETLTLDVTEDIGHIYKQYGNLTIEAGATLKPSNRCNGVLLLVNGDFVLDGVISVDLCAPLANDYENQMLSRPQVALCNLIGGAGGAGGQGRRSGAGGVGGKGHQLGGGYAGGGGGYYKTDSASNAYTGGASEPRPAYGITWPYKVTSRGNGAYGSGANGNGASYPGGASPGGGGSFYSKSGSDRALEGAGGAGSAYGGGAIWIYVKGNISISATGAITAKGGNGGAPGYYLSGTNYVGYAGGGGGGGGGIIALVYGGTFTNRGSLLASGGNAGYVGSSLGIGTAGSVGTVFTSPFSDLV